MKRRIFSLFMALCISLTLLPASAFAAESEPMEQPLPQEQLEQDEPAPEDPGQDEAVAAVQTLLNALPDVSALGELDEEALEGAYFAASEAYERYDALTEAQRAALTGAENMLAILEWANEQVAPLTGAESGTAAHTHYLCGGNTCSGGSHSAETEKTTFATEIRQDDDGKLYKGGEEWFMTANVYNLFDGTYYLSTDLILNHRISVFGKVTLCLNGHNITFNVSSENSMVLYLTVYSDFTLTDCTGNGKITHDNGSYGCGVQGDTYSSFSMYGGQITGNTYLNGEGGGVCMLHETSFNMYGGSISGNTAPYRGGGVYTNGTFNMYGGTISDNDCNVNFDSFGGGVFVTIGPFNMYGGTISDNTARYGGGMYANGTFNMYGGSISGNTAVECGGGVYMSDQINLYDGSISGNTVSSKGGGVYAGGTFTMSGGSISDNKSVGYYYNGGTGYESFGGGVFLGNKGTFTMSGGTISGNSVTDDVKSTGGAITMDGSGPQLTVSGNATITGNKKGTADSNVHVKSQNQRILVGVAGLDETARIGVTTANKPASSDDSILIVSADDEDSFCAQNFTSDDTEYSTEKIGSSMYLGLHRHSWTYTAGGATITAACACGSADGGTVTVKAPTGLTYDGSAKAATLTQTDWQGAAVSERAIVYKQGNTTLSGAPKDAGTYTASITLEGATASVDFTIQPKGITPTVDAISDRTYTGSEIKPTVTVKNGSTTIDPSEYTVTYTNNVDVGTATVTITDNEGGNYAWTAPVTQSFAITKATPSVTANAVHVTYDGEALDSGDISGETGGVAGTWSWKDGSAPKNVADSTSGGKTWKVVFTPTSHVNYEPVEKTVHVTIDPKPLTITGVTAAKRDYAAGNTTVTLTGGALRGVAGGDDVGVDLGTGTMSNADAGENKPVTTNITLTGAAKENYTLTQPTDVTVTINKIAPTGYTVPTGLTATYGQTLADVSLERYAGWSWKNAATSVGNVGNNSFDAVFTPIDTTNYKTATECVTVAVGKAAHSGQTANGSAKYGNPGEVDLNRLIVTGGVANYQSAADRDAILDGTPSIAGGKLRFKFKNDAALVNKTATITVNVTSTNYANYPITVTVTVDEKPVPTFTAPTANANLTYNGTAQALVTAGSATGGTMQYSLTSGSGYSSEVPKAANAGSYRVYYKVVGGTDYADTTENHFDVTIAAASLTITAHNKSAVVGAAMPQLTYSVSGLFGGDTLTTKPTLACAPDMSKADTYPITAAGADAGKNYTISYVPGALTVSDKQTPILTLTPSNTSLSGGGTVTLTVSGLPSGASCTVSCDAADITPTGSGSSWSVTLPNTTATYTFTVTFAGNGAYHGAAATCTVAVTQYTAPSHSGGNSSSNSTTTKNPNGSTTTTTTDKTTGTVTETTKNTDGSTITIETKTDGTVTATNKTATGTTATTVTDQNGNTTTTVSVSEKDAQSGESVTLPVDGVQPSTSKDAAEISVEVPKNTSVTVEVPVKNVTPGTVVMIVDENGEETVIPTTKMTENGVSVTLTENSTIKIVENSTDFSDVKDGDYFDDAVDFASSRGITGGTSATTFGSPEFCTRAQLVTFLWRAAGQPEAKSESGMSDVVKDTYYTEAVAWAFENGIVGGYGNGQFGPEGTVIREQTAVILYRFAQHTGMDTTQNGMTVQTYKDYDRISDYAVAATQWAVNADILQGYNGNLMPDNNCTRAQIVTMLYRLLG